MKKSILVIALVAMSTVASFAQGTINPLNGSLTRVKIDENGDGIGDRNARTSDNLQFTVFYGAANSSNPDKVVAGIMTIGTTDGVLVGLPSILALPNAGEAGAVVSLMIHAFNDIGWNGRTDIKQVTLAPAAGPGSVIWSSSPNAARFSPLIVTVPEPSTIALGVLGLGSLLLFRRRK
jgi:hypothetical protein